MKKAALFIIAIISFTYGQSQEKIIRWSSFNKGRPSDKLSLLERDILLNTNQYALTTWYDSVKGYAKQEGHYLDWGGTGEHNIRAGGSEAFALAVSIRTGVYDAARTGVSLADATAVTLKLIRSGAYRHKANEAGGWGDAWQSALWAAYTGAAGWMMWDDLQPEDRDLVSKMVVYEADRFNDYVVPYYKDRAGNVQFKGDSKAEENAWNAMILQLATVMMPNHPHWQRWMDKNIELMLSAGARPEDVKSAEMINGHRLSELLNGSNYNSDGTVINHNILHPDYMACNCFFNALMYALAGQPFPKAALFNEDIIYKTMTGLVYKKDSGEVTYPFPNDWGKKRRMHFALLDCQAHALGVDGISRGKGDYWEAFHAGDVLKMQQRSKDGRTYQSLEEDNYKGREEWVAMQVAQAYLTKWLQQQGGFKATNKAFDGGAGASADLKAQITPRNLLQPYVSGLRTAVSSITDFHPFPQSPQAWHNVLSDTVVQKIVHAGEKALQFEFRPIPATLTLEYVRTGNRARYERASFEKRNALWDLVLAESVEGSGRFADKILDGVWSICEESYWGLPAHLGLQKAGTGLPDVEDPTVDLFTAETAAVMAWTDYFAGPALEKISPLIRPRIYYEVNRRVFTPMQTAKYGYLGGGHNDAKLNNWAPWIMSNYLAAALLLEKEETRRVDAVGRVIRYTDQYINGLGEDGGCDEGPGYWSAAGGCVFDVSNLLNDASGGKINIYREPFIQKMGAYIYKTHIAGKYYINVADAAPQLVPDGLMLFMAGEAMRDSVMMGFGSWVFHQYPPGAVSHEQFHRSRGLYDLLMIKECADYPAAEPFIRDSWFADVQLMISRNDKGLFVAAHAGHNAESHNHNDVGDFVVYAGGQPVIIDAGSGTYTARTFSSHRYDLWFNTSAYHNLPVINGFQQKDGRQYAAEAVQYQHSGGRSSLVMDLAKAYPAGAGVQSWQRTVQIDKAAGVTVSDRFAMTRPLESLTQSFMTVCHVELMKGGRVQFETDSHEKVQLDYDSAFWDATVEKIDYTTPEDEGVRQHWDGKTLYRVLLKAKKLPLKTTIQYSIHL